MSKAQQEVEKRGHPNEQGRWSNKKASILTWGGGEGVNVHSLSNGTWYDANKKSLFYLHPTQFLLTNLFLFKFYFWESLKTFLTPRLSDISQQPNCSSLDSI